MKCSNCFQEIPDGSKFCPNCGAHQSETPVNDTVNTQAESTAQEESAVQSGTPVQEDAQTSYTSYTSDVQQTEPQYQSGYSSDQQSYSYQNTQYQSSQYQSDPYQSQTTYQSAGTPEKPVNWVPYLVLGILTTLCCCTPFGIVAIVYAAKINSSLNMGDTAGAERSAKTARIWIIASAVCGIIVEIILIGLGVIGEFGNYYYY